MMKKMKKLAALALALTLTASLLSTAALAAEIETLEETEQVEEIVEVLETTEQAEETEQTEELEQAEEIVETVEAEQTFIVGYFINAQKGIPSEMEIVYDADSTHTLIQNPFSVADGYVFAGWTVNVNGDNTVYQPGDAVVVPAGTMVEYKAKLVKLNPTAVIYVDAATGEFVSKIEDGILIPGYTVSPELVAESLGANWAEEYCPEGYELAAENTYNTSEKYKPSFKLESVLENEYDSSVLHCAIQFVFVNVAEAPEEKPAEKPCSVEYIYAAAGAVDGAVTAPEGVAVPEKIENEQSFRLSKADLSYGSGKIPEGYTFSGWYIEDSSGWYKVEDILRMFVITEHTEVYGYWTYTAPETPEKPGTTPEEPGTTPEEPGTTPEEPEGPDNGGNNNDNNNNQPAPPKTEIPETTVPDETIDEVETPLTPAPEAPVEETIVDEQTPLAAAPEVTETPETTVTDAELVIVDEVIPMGNLPQTGADVSNTSAIVLAVLALASGLAAVGFTLVLVSQKGKEN